MKIVYYGQYILMILYSLYTPLIFCLDDQKIHNQPKLLSTDNKHTPERTLGIIKPDAIQKRYSGDIIKLIELNNFTIIRMEKVKLTKKQAQIFYKAHKDKPFYKDLVDYMTSGPVILLALEKENCIKEWRELMGATDPYKARPGTLRKMFGTSISANGTHGSDSPEAAEQELSLFFPYLMPITKRML
jgi:nucleoside-diphosphate kinase